MQTASFGSASGLSVITNPIAPGEIVVDSIAEFADALQVNGLSGTALLVDGGGSAVFGAAASAALGANVTVGDAGGQERSQSLPTHFPALAILL